MITGIPSAIAIIGAPDATITEIIDTTRIVEISGTATAKQAESGIRRGKRLATGIMENRIKCERIWMPSRNGR